MDVLNDLYTYYNINYSIIDANMLPWGTMPNGSFGGVLGLLQRGEADFIPAPFAVTYTRSQVVDFTAHIDSTRAVLFSQKSFPKPITSILQPFSKTVWIILMMLVSFLIVILWLERHLHKFGKLMKNPTAFSNIVFMIVAITLNKSTNFHIHGRFQSIILQRWWFGSFVLATLYVGKFVSALSTQRQEDRVDSLEDFLQNRQYKLYLEKDTIVHSRVKYTLCDLLKEVFDEVQKRPGAIVTRQEAFHMVEKDPYSVFFTGSTTFDAHYSDICKIQQGGYIGKSTYFPVSLAFVVRRERYYQHIYQSDSFSRYPKSENIKIQKRKMSSEQKKNSIIAWSFL